MVRSNTQRGAEEIDRLFERAAEASKQAHEKIVSEFLKGFEKDYNAEVEQRRKVERN